jgi:hypothetical protein
VRIVRRGRVYDRDGIVTEVVKYCTKDIVAPGKYVPPERYAEVYKSFDGKRRLQASRGFMALGDKPVRCADCGAERSYRVRVVERPEWREGQTTRSPPAPVAAHDSS